jgi:hypothetical protein
MKTVTLRTPDATWLDHSKPHRFHLFFQGLIEHLKQNLKKVTVPGSHDYYTCGIYPDWRNPYWKPFKHLWDYCEQTGHDFYEAKDMIEERMGRKLICECQILSDERMAGRKELQSIF